MDPIAATQTSPVSSKIEASCNNEIISTTRQRSLSHDTASTLPLRQHASSCSSVWSGAYTCSEMSYNPAIWSDHIGPKAVRNAEQKRSLQPVSAISISRQEVPELPTPPHTPAWGMRQHRLPEASQQAPCRQVHHTGPVFVDLSQPFHPWSYEDVWFPFSFMNHFIPPTHVFITNHGVKRWNEAFYWLARGCRVWTKNWREVRLKDLLDARDSRGELTPEALTFAMWAQLPKRLWWWPSPHSDGEERWSELAQPLLCDQADVGMLGLSLLRSHLSLYSVIFSRANKLPM